VIRVQSGLLLAILFFSSINCFGQGERSPEIFIGYSNLQGEGLRTPSDNNQPLSNDFFKRRTTLHGGNAELTAFLFELFSVTGDISLNRKKTSMEIPDGKSSETVSTWYFLVGPSYVVPTSGMLQPFARVLLGGARIGFDAVAKQEVNNGTSKSSYEVSRTDFAMAIGGGLDIRVNERFKVRAIQFDYSPVFLGDRTVTILSLANVLRPVQLSGKRQDNIRFSFGVVF
jgi:hypothetical protein